MKQFILTVVLGTAIALMMFLFFANHSLDSDEREVRMLELFRAIMREECSK